jgi:hypothetical protein
MPSRDTDTHAVTLVDLPMVRRLSEKSTLLDCELHATQLSPEANFGVISSLMMLQQRGLYTFISRSEKQQAVGQFRYKADDSLAHIVYVAPELDIYADDTAWLNVLDTMAREAGRVGAQALVGEIEEQEPLFETMRAAGYAVYARQEVWMRDALNYPSYHKPLKLTKATEEDAGRLSGLFMSTVPRLVQQYALSDLELPHLIYEVDGQIAASIAYSEGRHGIYMVPYIRTDYFSDAPAIVESALRALPRAGKLPVYLCVRRYQDWLSEALEGLHFTLQSQQAVMVKHIAAWVRQPRFQSLSEQFEQVARPAKPKTNPYGVLVSQGHPHDPTQVIEP